MDEYLRAVEAHLGGIIDAGVVYPGNADSPMWVSALGVDGTHFPGPVGNTTAEFLPSNAGNLAQAGCTLLPGKRAYRYIDAPHGSSFYWDQPLIYAAHMLTVASGDAKYAEAAKMYTQSFLNSCVASNGIFLWGNHYFYDVSDNQVLFFSGDETPHTVLCENHDGSCHEIRPLPPLWHFLDQVDPRSTRRALKVSSYAHIFDQEAGGFNRHADNSEGCAFLEAGGVLAEALCSLSDLNGEQEHVGVALKVAQYSSDHRSDVTGLLENNPTVSRWDKFTTTTEVGFWARRLIRCYHLTGEERFFLMAEQAVAAYLKYGWNENAGRFAGRLNTSEGTMIDADQITLFQPGRWSDPWNPIFPGHDYPMAMAEACLDLFTETKDEIFRTGALRWARVVESTLPANRGTGAYAEHYGRAIHFLLRASTMLKLPSLNTLAHRIAGEAMRHLFTGSIFRGHPGEDTHYAVDGSGFLCLALLKASEIDIGDGDIIF